MVVLEGLLIQWGLIGFGVGSVSTAACGISESCGRRRLKREVDTLKAENETLAQTSARLQTQLDEFEDLSAFLTRSNLQIVSGADVHQGAAAGPASTHRAPPPGVAADGAAAAGVAGSAASPPLLLRPL